MAETTFIPSLDGYVRADRNDLDPKPDFSWADLRAHAGTKGSDSDRHFWIVRSIGEDTADTWAGLHRGIFLFDTSALGATAVVTAAVFKVYGYSKGDTGSFSPVLCVYSSSPASDSSLVAGDYDSLGSTEFSDTISYANFDTSGYNTFTLNAAGLAAINTTGITRLGTRERTYDALGATPTYQRFALMDFDVEFKELPGGDPPQLIVTHTVGTGGDTGFIWVEGTPGSGGYLWVEGAVEVGGYTWIE